MSHTQYPPVRQRLQRSELAVPGSNPGMFEKAAASAADYVFLDLEDAVAPDAKADAREAILAAIGDRAYGAREVLIRVNGLDTEWGRDDLAMAASAGVDGVVVPKVTSRKDVRVIDRYLDKAGASPDLDLWVMIETPLAVLNIKKIAKASAKTRLTAFVMGTNDLAEQTVVGGRAEDLELVEQEVQEQFARKRPVRLKTEGAFHTYYMDKAAELFRPVLEEASFGSAEARVLSNYTGGFHEDDPATIREGLYYQLFNPVMWHANLLTAFGAGVQMIFEFGGGIGSAETPDGKRPNLCLLYTSPSPRDS